MLLCSQLMGLDYVVMLTGCTGPAGVTNMGNAGLNICTLEFPW